mgnify:CR=1 FL=1
MDYRDLQNRLYKKIVKASRKYGGTESELHSKIKSVLEECDIDVAIMDNVYIGANVTFPDVFGCYLSEGKIVAYFTNDKAVKNTREYEDFVAFMWMFVQEAPRSSLYRI